MPVNYQTIPTALQATLARYVSAPDSQEGFGVINETIPRTFLAGRLLSRSKRNWSTGLTWDYELQFNTSEIGEWVGAGEKLALRGTRATTRGSVPRRFYQWGWFKAYHELDHNSGRGGRTTREVIVDILKQAKEDACVAIVTALENVILALDGNYAHDGTGGNFLLPFGLRYWFTIDGLHITGDTSRTIAGINPSTQTLWKNGYINPVEASDGMAPIASVYDLRKALNRALRMLRHDSIKQSWGELAKDVQKPMAYDPDGPGKPSDLMILMDPKTSIDYRDVVFDREDNVSRDQARGRPIFKGIEVGDYDNLGVNSNGYGLDEAGNPLWTDRGGDYASGNWAGYGETFVVRADLFHFLVHPQHFPFIKRPYEPEGMMGVAYEGDAWVQTACRSRRRGGVYIGPYAVPVAA